MVAENNNTRAWLDAAPSSISEEVDRLLALVAQMRETEVIYPAQGSILNALSHTAPKDVRVVILGQDPYHEPNQAMGLSFSVPVGQKLPPSLRNIYKEMSSDLGCPIPTGGDLTSWAKQGVLLLNTTLTVQEHKANSHAKLGWKTVTDYLVQACMNLPQPIVFLAWGRHAIDMAENALANAGEGAGNKLILSSTHPSPLSANRASGELPSFMGSAPFSKANEFLGCHGVECVDWASVL